MITGIPSMYPKFDKLEESFHCYGKLLVNVHAKQIINQFIAANYIYIGQSGQVHR